MLGEGFFVAVDLNVGWLRSVALHVTTEPHMNTRAILYAMIPLGFVVIVGIMLLGGEAVQETTDSPMADEVEEVVE